MKKFKHFHDGFIALFLFFAPFGAMGQAPTVVITDIGNNNWKIGVQNLDLNDLVFYRFSDGYDMSAMKTIVNGEASVVRQFQKAQVKVSAFIAEKDGPIGLAMGDILNPLCPNCIPPAAPLLPGQFMLLRETSWDAFTDPSNPAVLNDTKTNPWCATPNSPWFFLPISIKAPGPNTKLMISIPPGMTIKGAVVKNKWIPLIAGQGPVVIGDFDVASLNYVNLGLFGANMSPAFGKLFNIHLILTSDTEIGENSVFSAQLYDANGAELGPSSEQEVLTLQNPHDPNHLTAYQNSMCASTTDIQLLTYRVDFQNFGPGPAESVIVAVAVNDLIVDALSLDGAMINSSHNLSVFNATPDLVTFNFKNIQLPGLGADPQPSPNETKGWVEFTVDSRTCIAPEIYGTGATVTFIGNNGMFNETIPTNNVEQNAHTLLPCEIDPICFTGSNRVASTGIAPISAGNFKPKCYPSLIQNILTVDVSETGLNGLVTVAINDLSGRVWLNKLHLVSANAGSKFEISTADLPTGMYLVQIKSSAGFAVFKVIKE